MVRMTCQFVSRRVSWQFDRLDLSCINELLEVAIDGRHAQRGHLTLRRDQHFGRRQRAPCLSQRCAD
jgi:hypothetical protein